MRRPSRAARATAAALVMTGAVVLGPADGASAEAQTKSNGAPITFSGTSSSAGSPYPSIINVSGLEGPIVDVDVTIDDIELDDLGELQLLVVSPSNEAEIIASSICLGVEAASVTFTFDQDAEAVPGQGSCTGGIVRPHDACGSFCHAFDAFTGAHETNLDHFNGENANGQWRLYAYRECGGFTCNGTENIGEGWKLTIETGGVTIDTSAGDTTTGPADPYPLTFTIPAEEDLGVISDLEVSLDGVFHTFPDDLDIMVEKVGGPTVMLMSDACGYTDLVDQHLEWDDEATGLMPDEGDSAVCAGGRFRPTDHDPGDSLPGPAPAAPYADELAVFDGLDPRGEWRLWVADDSGGDEGFIVSGFGLGLQVEPRIPGTTITKAPKKRSTKRSVKVGFTSDVETARFQCRLDRGRWKTCSSPTKLKGLKPGRHRLEVRAIDRQGDRDPSPAVARWRVLKR